MIWQGKRSIHLILELDTKKTWKQYKIFRCANMLYLWKYIPFDSLEIVAPIQDEEKMNPQFCYEKWWQCFNQRVYHHVSRFLPFLLQITPLDSWNAKIGEHQAEVKEELQSFWSPPPSGKKIIKDCNCIGDYEWLEYSTKGLAAAGWWS